MEKKIEQKEKVGLNAWCYTRTCTCVLVLHVYVHFKKNKYISVDPCFSVKTEIKNTVCFVSFMYTCTENVYIHVISVSHYVVHVLDE